ncbi:MAG: TadE/TadG family type IV pilus assembly protein [Alphaproteobacteria bacterium]
MSFSARCKQLIDRMRADSKKGSAAIEFAMVAPVFFVLLMGTMEAGIMFFAQSALQNAVNDAARLVRTGQTACYTTSGGNCVAMTQAEFKTKVCDAVSVLLKNCTSGSLQFDVNAYPSGYSAASNSSPLDSGNNLKTLTAFNVGNACDVVLVRAFYKWPVFTPGLNYFMANVAGNYHLLATAAAFRNEPYDNNAGGCA